MRKCLLRLMGIAVAVVSVVCCQKQEMLSDDSVSGLSFVSGKPEFGDQTKTEWTGTGIQWSQGDKIRVAYTCDGVWQNADGSSTGTEESGRKTAKLYESEALPASGEVGQFNVPGNFKGTASGTYQFYGVYPSSVCTDAPDFKFAPSLTFVVPSVQTPLADSFDPLADVMLAKSAQVYTSLPKGEPVPMSWKRIVAHACFTFSNINGLTSGEKISYIELTADKEADMVGKHYMLLDQRICERASSSAVVNVLKLNADNLIADETNSVKVWASFLPATIKSLNVVIATDKATYTREIPVVDKTFKQNARNVLNIKMDQAVREEFASSKLPFDDGFDAVSGTNEIKSLDNFNIEGAVYGGRASGTIRLAASSKSGIIETKEKFDLSEPFHIILNARGWDNDEVELTVTAGTQSADIFLNTSGADAGFEEYVLNFNTEPSPASIRIAPKKRIEIDRIRIASGTGTLSPVIVIDNNILSVPAAGDICTVKYSVKNPVEGRKLSVKSDQRWVNEFDTSIDGELSFIVEENTSAERTADVTLSYEGAEPAVLKIIQSAAGQVEVQSTVLDLTTKSSSVSSYVSESKYGDWVIGGGANSSGQWPYFKMGGKNSNISRFNPCYIHNTVAVGHEVAEVTVHLPAGSLKDKAMSVNRWGVYVYSDSEFVNEIEFVEGGVITNSDLTFSFKPVSGGVWPANSYYKIVWDLSNTGSKNGIVCVDNVTLSSVAN